jgi:hypothetical protein
MSKAGRGEDTLAGEWRPTSRPAGETRAGTQASDAKLKETNSQARTQAGRLGESRELNR